MSKKSGDRPGPKAKYREGEPDLTETGIGKNYKGYRIFHTKKHDRMEYIGNDYSLRAPTRAEADLFRKDIARASRKDPRIARYLEDFPSLRAGSAFGGAPAAETIVKTGS